MKALAGGLRWVLTFMQDHIGVEKVQPQRSRFRSRFASLVGSFT
ncbi:hypothetical protein L838_3398 [Mycobacterium avium MAV_120709_2344]|nr:hypothetical protein L838_3398 [Mycobacterium avium MAV_120709_2344]